MFINKWQNKEKNQISLLKYVPCVDYLLLGEKNGQNVGMKLNIVQKNAVVTKIILILNIDIFLILNYNIKVFDKEVIGNLIIYFTTMIDALASINQN